MQGKLSNPNYKQQDGAWVARHVVMSHAKGREARKRPSSAPVALPHFKNSFHCDPNWRNVREQPPAEKAHLEAGWDSQHCISFSRNNGAVNPLLRDYFDRPRAAPSREPGYELKRAGKYHPWWRLDFGPGGRHSQAGLGQDRPSSAAAHRQTWDLRHQLTASRTNDVNCDGRREYFGRFVDSEAERMLPADHVKVGITKHYFPHFQRGNSDGCDKSRRDTTRILAEYAYAAAAVKCLLPTESDQAG